MKIKFKAIFILSLVSFGMGFFPNADAQESESEDKTAATITLQQALRNHEAAKQQEQETFAKNLAVNLNQIIENWIITARTNQENLLGSRIQQSWEKLSKLYPISAGHYDYYLRGYNYNLIKNDIAKTNSLIDPYIASVIIREDLYVEKNHAPNVSDANPYFYTVSTDHSLNFEYKKDKFILVNSDSKIVSIQNNCPIEIKRLHL